MSNNHFVIIVPGLGDKIYTSTIILWYFRRYGLKPIVHPVGWHDSDNTFRPKLNPLVKLIDNYHRGGNKVSLIGTSAGGSAVLNAFIERKKVVYRVVNVCGRLRVGATTGFRSFTSKTKSSPSFAESVKLVEVGEGELTISDRRRILTIRPIFDEVVPADTQILTGAKNIQIPVIGHGMGIALALTIFSRPIFQFLS